MKFGFSLSPLRIPSRAENDALRNALEGNFEPYSPPTSPFIDRQELSWSLERDLREACDALVKSAGSGSEPKSDISISLSQLVKQKHAMNKTATVEKTKSAIEAKPPTLSVDKKWSASRTKSHAKTVEPQSAVSDKGVDDSPILTALPQMVGKTKSNKTGDFPIRRDSLSNNKKTPAHRLPKTTLNTKIVEEYSQTKFNGSDSGSDSPPRSSSTDHPLSASTAMTSVAMTPLMKSFTESPRQGPLDLKTYQSAVSRADTKAMEWMNMQKQKAVEEPSPQNNRSRTATTESNSSSFASSFRNMFRGRSRSRSREPTARPGSRLGETVSTIGRQFSLRKQQSTTSLVETAKEQGPRLRFHKSSGDLKAEVDLNRKLPPLPGLDTYKEPEPVKEPLEVGTTETTIVQIKVAPTVRPKSSSAGHTAKPPNPVLLNDTAAVTAPLLQHKRSISMKTAAVPLPTEPARKMSLQSSADSCFTPATSHTPSRSIDVVKAAHKAKSIENLQQLKNSIPQPPTPKSTRSAATSRPVSRSSSKAPAKYSIIPPQRAPSNPYSSSKSAASSIYQLPPRPATRDAPTPQYASSRPSTSGPSVGKPAVNFSRKYPVDIDSASIIGDLEQLSTSHTSSKKKNKGIRESPAEITALPPMPSKRPKGIRRMLSSVSLGVTKIGKPAPEKNVWTEHQRWRQAPS